MNRLARWISGLLLGKPPAPKPPILPIAPPPPGDRAAFLALLNAARARLGKAPMRADPTLDAIAQSWASQMDFAGVEAHGDFEGRVRRTYPDAFAAENVGIAGTVAGVFAAWMNDPPHRANLMGDYDLVGLGRSGVYWCCDLARRGR